MQEKNFSLVYFIRHNCYLLNNICQMIMNFFSLNLFDLTYLHQASRVLFSLHPKGHPIRISGYMMCAHLFH